MGGYELTVQNGDQTKTIWCQGYGAGGGMDFRPHDYIDWQDSPLVHVHRCGSHEKAFTVPMMFVEGCHV